MEQKPIARQQHPPELGYRVDDLIIDIGRQRVSRGGEVIPLSALSFELLLTLARAAPNILTFKQLIDSVWSGLVVGPETVSQRVKVVREALRDDAQAPRYILGVRGRGYRMLAGVTPWEGTPTEPVSLETVAPEPAPSAEKVSPTRARRSPTWTTLAAFSVAIVAAIAWIVFARVLEPDSAPPQQSSAKTSVLVTQQPRTIAVLPLLDISPDGGNEYLGDGLAEELSSRLARIPGLRVAARTSSFAFKGRHEDVRMIGQALGVHNVLEGSVRRDGNHVRVTAQLIDARSGYNVWSQTYDRPWRDLLVIQDDLAHSIIDALQLVLSSDVMARLEQQPTANFAAFELYLTGLAHLRQNKATDPAEQSFREALALDPRFARAYAGLCEAYAIAYENTRDITVAAKAEAACNKALSLDASLMEVDMALGRLYVMSGRSVRAIGNYRSAISRNPLNADAHIGLGRAYEEQKRTAEAEATYRRAIEAEPGYWGAYSALGGFLMQQGRAREAVTAYQQAARLATGNASAMNNLGAALQMTGDLEGAAKAFERSLELAPTRSAYSNTGSMYYYLGRYQDAAAMFRQATERGAQDHRVWGNLADALFQMKDQRGHAIRTYERAISLAERELRVNSNDAITRAQLAYYYARIGDIERAASYMAGALESRPDIVWVQYYAALVALQTGARSAALEAVERAIRLGYPARLMRAAPEFSALRDDPRFADLLASSTRISAR